MSDFSARLRRMREGKRMSLEKLGELSGMSASGISAWERGVNDPTLTSMRRLAEALGVRVLDFFMEEEAADSKPPTRRESELKWFCAGLPEDILIAKLVQALQDGEAPLEERVNRASVFLDELRRRGSTSRVDAAARAAAVGSVAEMVQNRPPKSGRSTKAALTIDKTFAPKDGALPGAKAQR